MKGIKLLVLTTAGLAALFTAASAMATMPLPSGWYLEGNAGGTRISNANYGSNTSTTTSGIGWNLNAGYKFMPYFAAEIGYTGYGKVKIKSNGTQVANATNYSYDLAGKAILPISDSGFDMFAKLGVARINNHITISNASYISANGLTINAGSHSVTAAYFGSGGEYNFSNNMAVNVQWERAKGNTTTGNLDLYSVGLTYTFG